MGTHPIFESDFDCLTEMSDGGSEVDPNLAPVQEEQVTPSITGGFLFSVEFFQKYGWYIVFALIAFSFVKKNLERHLQAFREWQEVASIKKNPDQFQSMEEARMARLERLQAQSDAAAQVKAKRDSELANLRQERIEAARENGGGKESMARWEEAKKKDNLPTLTGNTTRGATVTEKKQKPKFNWRDDYNPMTGAGGGASKFKPNRAQPKRGG